MEENQTGGNATFYGEQFMIIIQNNLLFINKNKLYTIKHIYFSQDCLQFLGFYKLS